MAGICWARNTIRL